MSSKVQSVLRRQVFDASVAAVEAARRDGGMIAVTVVARQILEAVPDCDLSLPELVDQIARLASPKGVVVEFGTDRTSAAVAEGS